MAAIRVDMTPPDGRRLNGHYGAWRSAAALPAMLGSLFTLLVLFSWLGQWEGMVLLIWLTSAGAMFARRGERVAVRLGYGFRRPSDAQLHALASSWSQALTYTQLCADNLDLYMQRSRGAYAFAAGGRSIAVTSGVVTEFESGRLTRAQLVAVLAHEIGHLQTQATRFTLATLWLATPWRFLSRLVLASASAFAQRQPPRLLVLVVGAAVVVAIGQSVQHGHWSSVVALISIALAAVLSPLADAAASRRSEYAADRYAVDIGLGPHLALALEALNGGRAPRAGWATRLVSRHPDVASRIDRLPAPLG